MVLKGQILFLDYISDPCTLPDSYKPPESILGGLGPNFAFFLIFYVTQGLEGILGTFIFTKLMTLIKGDNFLDFYSFDLKF